MAGGTLVTFSAIEEFGGRGGGGPHGGRWGGKWTRLEGAEEEEAAVDEVERRKTKLLIESRRGR
jgi:hypothetical protein